MAKPKAGKEGQKQSEEAKMNRGKIFGEVMEEFKNQNDLEGFKKSLKEKLAIHEELTTKILASLKSEYLDYQLSQTFPSLVVAGKKEVKWNQKGLVISSRLVPADLFSEAMKQGIKYQIKMDQDLSVHAYPIPPAKKE